MHAWAGQVILAGGPDTSSGYRILNAVNETLFHDSTLYFALLSGLLFSLVLQSRGWHTFFRRRARNILAPYVLMTGLYTWCSLGADDHLHLFQGSLSDYLGKVAANLPLGDAMFHLWYMPVILVLSLMTPLLMLLVTASRARWLLWIVILIPLVASRTWPAASATTFLYFLGAYTAGLYAGVHYNQALGLIARHRRLVSVAAIATSMLLIAAFLQGLDDIGPVSARESLFYVQKLAVAALVILWFQQRESELPDWLDTISTFAFAIYFLHAMALLLLQEGQMALTDSPVSAFAATLLGGLYLLVAVAAPLAIGMLTRRMLGTRSRIVLGS